MPARQLYLYPRNNQLRGPGGLHALKYDYTSTSPLSSFLVEPITLVILITSLVIRH
jgi:hypothetical protein